MTIIISNTKIKVVVVLLSMFCLLLRSESLNATKKSSKKPLKKKSTKTVPKEQDLEKKIKMLEYELQKKKEEEEAKRKEDEMKKQLEYEYQKKLEQEKYELIKQQQEEYEKQKAWEEQKREEEEEKKKAEMEANRIKWEQEITSCENECENIKKELSDWEAKKSSCDTHISRLPEYQSYLNTNCVPGYWGGGQILFPENALANCSAYRRWYKAAQECMNSGISEKVNDIHNHYDQCKNRCSQLKAEMLKYKY